MVIRVKAKCDDRCNIQYGENERNDYVPRGIGIGEGDYISLEIDAKTGQILNWPNLSEEELKEALWGNQLKWIQDNEI